jgi:hypothetical protein
MQLAATMSDSLTLLMMRFRTVAHDWHSQPELQSK